MVKSSDCTKYVLHEEQVCSPACICRRVLLFEADDAWGTESGFRHLLFGAMGGQLMCVEAL